MRRATAALAISLALGGCQTAGPPSAATPARPVALSEAQRLAVEDGVKAVLIDPLSALFENVRAVQSPKGETVVCGLVNSKNRMGGYAGREPFNGKLSADPAAPKFVDMKMPISLDDSWGRGGIIRECRGLGIDPEI